MSLSDESAAIKRSSASIRSLQSWFFTPVQGFHGRAEMVLAAFPEWSQLRIDLDSGCRRERGYLWRYAIPFVEALSSSRDALYPQTCLWKSVSRPHGDLASVLKGQSKPKDILKDCAAYQCWDCIAKVVWVGWSISVVAEACKV